LISDAGTPLFSDAGQLLVAACHREGIAVLPIPGANAVAAALSCAGFGGSRFVFEGFLPARAAARIRRLKQLRSEQRTMVFFEAPHRLAATLADMIDLFGGARDACLAKELTKIHEAVVRGSLLDIDRWLAQSTRHSKGEFVILVAACAATPSTEITLDAAQLVRALADYLPPSKAAAVVAHLSGLARQRLYPRKSADS